MPILHAQTLIITHAAVVDTIPGVVDAIDFPEDPDIAFATPTELKNVWPGSQKGILRSMDTDPLAIREHFITHELDVPRRPKRQTETPAATK